MEDQRKKTGADAAGGTLNDEAASGGEKPVSFGSLMMEDFGGDGKEDSESGRGEAISSTFILSGSQGTSEVSEILARREGDSEVFMDGEGAARTVYQQRIIDAARAAREKYFEARDAGKKSDMAMHGARLVRYVEALTKEGLSEDPDVVELIREEEVNELSVVMDAEVVASAMRAHGERPTVEMDSDSLSAALLGAAEQDRDIGSEIDKEFGAPAEVDGVEGEAHAPEQDEEVVVEESDVVARAQLDDTALEEPEWMAEHLGGEKADTDAEPPPLPREGGAENDSIDGRPTAKPEPVARAPDTELEKIAAGGLLLTPLGDEEREKIARLDELSPDELRTMAKERSEQADTMSTKDRSKRTEMGKWYLEYLVKLRQAGLSDEEGLRALTGAKMDLMIQATHLDLLAANREAEATAQPAKEPIQPKRPSALPRTPGPSSSEEGGAEGEGESARPEDVFFEQGDRGAFAPFSRPDGRVDVARFYRSEERGAAHVMGTGRKGARTRERTALGLRAADPEAGLDDVARGETPAVKRDGTQIIASGAIGSDERPVGLGVAGNQGEGTGSKPGLSDTSLFGQFNRDPETAQIKQEGSGALNIRHIEELSGAKPITDPVSQRIPTGQLRAVRELAGVLEGTGSVSPGQMSDELRAVQAAAARAAAEPAAGEDLGKTKVVAPEAVSAVDGKQKVWGERAFAETHISPEAAASGGAVRGEGKLGATKNEKPEEDFSIYGDIFYAVEKVYMESSGIPAELNELNNFAKLLPDAIEKARKLPSVATEKRGETLVADGEGAGAPPSVPKNKKGETLVASAERARVARLEKFNADFFEIPKGKDGPERSFLAYTQWLAEKKREYSQISDVHELLSKALAGDFTKENARGISPGEYGRVALMRLCNAAIKSGTLDDNETGRVEQLREMLEPVDRGGTDLYEPVLAADNVHEMIVGFATKQERARVRQLEQDLEKYKITAAEYELKRDMMAKVLAEVLVSSRNAELDSAKTKARVKEAIMALAPDDPFERSKYMDLIKDAQAGAGGEAGKDIRKAAEKAAATVDIPPEEAARIKAEAGRVAAQPKPGPATPIGRPSALTPDQLREALYGTDPRRRPQAHAVPAQRAAPKQHGPVARSIGTAITMAVGAGVLATGLWLGQNGIITLGTRADEAAQKPVAAQVEKVAEESSVELPAGLVDAGKASAKKDAGNKAAVAPISKKDAGANADSGFAPDSGVDRVIKAVREAQPVQPPVAVEKHARDKTGLKAALDDWCREGHGLLVSKEMLRAAYASVEGGLDGKVLPEDVEWVPLMLKMKFPNRMIELSVMSDLARSEIDAIEKYAALMRLSIVLGDRAGNPRTFPTTIKESNAKGVSLPPLDKESHMGKIESAKSGERCLFAAYHETVTVRMAQIEKEALESGMSKKEFRAAVSEVLGKNAERIMKLYDSSNYQANQEEREGACKALTGGKRGSAALERALNFVLPKWEASHQRAKAKIEKHQKEVDSIIGPAPKGTNAPKANVKKAKKASPCAGKQGLNYFSCVSEQNQKKLEEAAKIGDKKMHAPKKGKEAGSASKAPHGPVRD